MFESFIGHIYGDALLADSVDTILYVYYSCTTDAVFSEVSEWAENDVRSWCAVSLR